MDTAKCSLEWVTVPTFDNFEATRCGRLRKKPRAWTRGRMGPAREIKGYIDRHGYRRVSVCSGGVAASTGWHRMVALAFHPNPEHKSDVNHKDGNPLNNHADNLEWATRQENLQHAARVLKTMGVIRGERSPAAVLTATDVSDIRILYAAGMTYRALAALYGVAKSTVRGIVMRWKWAHIA